MGSKYTIILTIMDFGARLDVRHASTDVTHGNEYLRGKE